MLYGGGRNPPREDVNIGVLVIWSCEVGKVFFSLLDRGVGYLFFCVCVCCSGRFFHPDISRWMFREMLGGKPDRRAVCDGLGRGTTYVIDHWNLYHKERKDVRQQRLSFGGAGCGRERGKTFQAELWEEKCLGRKSAFEGCWGRILEKRMNKMEKYSLMLKKWNIF